MSHAGTEELAFRERFDRWFRRVYCYTHRRVSDRVVVEHIVETALERNVHVLQQPTDERESAVRLMSDVESLTSGVNRSPTAPPHGSHLPR